jgi:hypothetical protein
VADRLAIAAVEEDRPVLDAGYGQHPVRVPGVPCEALADRLLGRRGDGEQDVAAAFEGSAENDEPIVDKRVHEAGVLVPAVLLAQVARPGPRAAALEPDGVKLGHQSSTSASVRRR